MCWVTLHKGQAHDTLEKLRMAICEYTCNIDFKRDNVQGQCAVTHAERIVQKLEGERKQAAELYRHAYMALLRLGLASDDQSLQPLPDSQLFMKDTTKLAQLGDNRKEDPWFWQAEHVRNSDIEDQDWVVESKIPSALEGALMLTKISG